MLSDRGMVSIGHLYREPAVDTNLSSLIPTNEGTSSADIPGFSASGGAKERS